MSQRKYYVVIGKNFGDEGKGLATDYLCSNGGKCLGVRYNGGAQSGHTVESPGKRFVFHELSSGSMQGADTLWAHTYHPDLYKLDEEYEAFHALTGLKPKVHVHEAAGFTTIYDVLINMALETKRGKNRHGSCGMGIYESNLREQSGFKLTISDIAGVGTLLAKLRHIQEDYVLSRLDNLGLKLSEMGEYGELITNPTVCENYAEAVCRNAELVTPLYGDNSRDIIASYESLWNSYDRVVFEGGQGLLLDEDCERFMPNVSASKTGLTNVELILGKTEDIIEVFYVTRSYVTRHGAGFLPCECDKALIGNIKDDVTNVTNEWQGNIRYGYHESIDEFISPVHEDLESVSLKVAPNILLTHLNETDGKIAGIGDASFVTRSVPCHWGIYTSSSPYSYEIQRVK